MRNILNYKTKAEFEERNGKEMFVLTEAYNRRTPAFKDGDGYVIADSEEMRLSEMGLYFFQNGDDTVIPHKLTLSNEGVSIPSPYNPNLTGWTYTCDDGYLPDGWCEFRGESGRRNEYLLSTGTTTEDFSYIMRNGNTGLLERIDACDSTEEVKPGVSYVKGENVYYNSAMGFKMYDANTLRIVDTFESVKVLDRDYMKDVIGMTGAFGDESSVNIIIENKYIDSITSSWADDDPRTYYLKFHRMDLFTIIEYRYFWYYSERNPEEEPVITLTLKNLNDKNARGFMTGYGEEYGR